MSTQNSNAAVTSFEGITVNGGAVKVLREGDTNTHDLVSDLPLEHEVVNEAAGFVNFVETNSPAVLVHNDHGAHCIPVGEKFSSFHQQVLDPEQMITVQVKD